MRTWGVLVAATSIGALLCGCGSDSGGFKPPEVSSVNEEFAGVEEAIQKVEIALDSGSKEEIGASLHCVCMATGSLTVAWVREEQSEEGDFRDGREPHPTILPQMRRLREAMDALISGGGGFYGEVGGRKDVEATRRDLAEVKKAFAEVRSAYAQLHKGGGGEK